MSFSFKNIFVIIICIILAGLGYFLMTDTSGTAAAMNSNETVRQDLLNKTQGFIERSTKLQQINIDQSFFTDETFTSLRSFETAVPNQSVGRDDIFGATSNISETEVVSSEVEDNEEEAS
jgi:hypothetical protein